MATRHEYSHQALTYDRTRAASPSVLGPLHTALGPAPGRRLVDIGGGTGNYSVGLRELGWEPIVADLNAGMLGRASAKGLSVVRADAAELPLGDESADAAILVSMLHHVPDADTALAEARRIVAPGGRLAVMAFVREHLDVHWVLDYFPTVGAFFRDAHQSLAELTAALPGADVEPLFYDDVVDGSMAALCRRPELLLDPERRRQTSFFERVADETPAELEAAMARLAGELAAGHRPQDADADRRARIGDASLIVWPAPAELWSDRQSADRRSNRRDPVADSSVKRPESRAGR